MKKNIKFKVFIIFIVAILAYPFIGKLILENKTREFLQDKGCIKTDIENICIKHSYLNLILSYDEWSILVEFRQVPQINYSFTTKNKDIIFRHVVDSKKTKEELKVLEEKFLNGDLCSQTP